MIKNVKNYWLFNDVNSNSFNTKLYLDFQPDEIVIKKIDFIAANPLNSFFLIYSNLVNDYIGYSRSTLNNISNELQTRFKIINPIRGSFDFSFRNIEDDLQVIEGELIICLEFIEYEK